MLSQNFQCECTFKALTDIIFEAISPPNFDINLKKIRRGLQF